MTAPRIVGVVGAGTMGAGIAQLAAQSGLETVLHDPVPEALERGVARMEASWAKRPVEGARERLRPAGALEELEACDLIIEAAPERLELKGELLRELAGHTGAVLATNTSSLPVTAVGAASGSPGRVVGMHFFNPPPVMRLVEIVAGVDTSPESVAVARAAAETMGRRVVEVSDGIGFLVNRCNRPFSLEALRIVHEGLATPEQVDRICRLGGGFRMGPFELMDLVGIDVGYAVAQSFMELSFGEPRWKPSMLQAKLVAAGQLGRKTGRGWYSYEDGPHRPADPDPREPGGGAGRNVQITGSGPLAEQLRERAQAAGFDLGGGGTWLTVATGADAPDAGPLVAACASSSLAARGIPGAAGFHLLAPLGRLVELTRVPATSDESARRAEEFFSALGLEHEWVEDAPGLVLGRIVCGLVNEALFAVGEGVGSADDVDTGLTLGLNHPRGAVSWGREIGFENVLATIDGLFAERHEERYRAAPLLRRVVATGESIT
ncbi:MAG TPA: 3-hydroxyacyl-CoA dehydrogenase NAD-binding domain-containing protein [Thermoleophilaceae bacterium]|nr:3-hydroxyacyl-CoA dehydrogenase NAD-binding domain-containing protein [Thermoleophilaceae bacterium]